MEAPLPYGYRISDSVNMFENPWFSYGCKIFDFANIAELIRVLSDRYGNDMRGEINRSAILVNGRNILHLKGKRTRLKDGDVVYFANAAAGG